jgi:hypothetical protein
LGVVIAVLRLERNHMGKRLHSYCIYTTVSPKKLKAVDGEITESKTWRTGLSLLQKARDAGEDLAIVFSDAVSDCEALVAWAIVSDIQTNDGITKCTFEKRKNLPRGKHLTQELRLRSTGRNIAPGFIRPYALCHTPAYLA